MRHGVVGIHVTIAQKNGFMHRQPGANQVMFEILFTHDRTLAQFLLCQYCVMLSSTCGDDWPHAYLSRLMNPTRPAAKSYMLKVAQQRAALLEGVEDQATVDDLLLHALNSFLISCQMFPTASITELLQLLEHLPWPNVYAQRSVVQAAMKEGEH